MKYHSIIQEDIDTCFMCGEPAHWDDPLDWHHAFNGSMKKKSEKHGLMVRLHHHECHIFASGSIHQDAEKRKQLKGDAQRILIEQYGWTEEQCLKEFYKIYL